MRVDFYHLTQGSAATALPQLAGKALAAGQRMVIAEADPARRQTLSEALWAAPGFLAHGEAGGEDDARQPLLIGEDFPGEPANGARLIALADGAWRDAAKSYERVFLLFGDSGREAARACWRQLDGEEGCERRYWVQSGEGWREGP